MVNYKNKQSGFIKGIALTLVALVALKYFWNIDVIGYIEGPVEKVLAWVIAKFK